MSYRIHPRSQHLDDYMQRIRAMPFSVEYYTSEYKRIPMIQWLEENVGSMHEIENRVNIYAKGWNITVDYGFSDSKNRVATKRYIIHIAHDTDEKLMTEFILRFQ